MVTSPALPGLAPAEPEAKTSSASERDPLAACWLGPQSGRPACAWRVPGDPACAALRTRGEERWRARCQPNSDLRNPSGWESGQPASGLSAPSPPQCPSPRPSAAAAGGKGLPASLHTSVSVSPISSSPVRAENSGSPRSLGDCFPVSQPCPPVT